MAQIGLYAHLCQDSRTSGNRPPPELLTPFPGRVLKNMDGPEGSAKEDERKIF
jgi:hypothetical protein